MRLEVGNSYLPAGTVWCVTAVAPHVHVVMDGWMVNGTSKDLFPWVAMGSACSVEN